MKKIILDNENLISELKEKGEIFLLYFSAPWCGPCKVILPVIEAIQEENQDIDIIKMNVDVFPTLAKEYGIRNIPTILFFNKGEEKKRTIGMQSKKQITDIIAELKND